MEKRNLKRSAMTPTTEAKTSKIIHIARIIADGGRVRFIFLRKREPAGFEWFEEVALGKENPTGVVGNTIEETIRLGVRQWRQRAYRNINCGFRYTLPERDEHGTNALFHQMAASQSSMNGVYYDEELGNNCFVQNASQEALDLWKRLKT